MTSFVPKYNLGTRKETGILQLIGTPMKDYLGDWAKNVVGLTSASLKQAVEVEGIRDKHMAGRWETARIRILAKPHEGFRVTSDDLTNKTEMNEDSYLDWAVMGILDVLLVSESYPLKNVSIAFLEAEIHPVNSSRMAFRQAGRDAGRKLFQIVKANAFRPPSNPE